MTATRAPDDGAAARSGTTRRQLLRSGALGFGAAVAGTALRPATALAATGAETPAVQPARGCPLGHSGFTGTATPSATFGRIFPDLPAFADNTPSLRQALTELGAPGGPLDARDDLFGPNGGPVRLITDPNFSLVNRNNPHDTAGMTFVGQFIDHDLTFDATTKLGVAADPRTSPNGRTARFDLDSVYGAGPVLQSELYDPADPITFRLETGGLFEDVPRRPDLTAVIGDPRNDSNLLVQGLHAAFLRFHNRTVNDVRVRGEDPIDTFSRARRLVQWHYQWLVVNQVLPNFVGQPLVDDVLHRGPRFFSPNPAYIPVEFSGAAYRFGHSMVRPSYRANLAGDSGQPFFGLIFDSRVTTPDDSNPTTDPGDLRGGFRAARRFVGWQTFFDFGGAHTADVRPNKVIDTILSTPLFALPTSAIAHIPGAPGPVALPQRTLLRHLTWTLPSGQTVARRMGVQALARRDLADLAGFGHDLDRSTPLWLYVLREADLVNDGQFLGPVGGRLVCETMVGLLQADPDSYLTRNPRWRPTLGGFAGDYSIVDFLRYAGVDPDSRGQ